MSPITPLLPLHVLLHLLLLLLLPGDGVDGSLISNRGLRSQEPQMFAERSHTESQIRKALPQDFLSSYGRKWLRLLETSAPRSSQFVREFGLFPSQLFLTWLADERNWGNFDSSAVTSRSRTEVSRQSQYLNAFNSWLKQSKWKNPFLSAVTRSSRREGSRNLLPYFSFDSWFSVFQETFKRDMILNVGKVGGIILLYYLAPDLLSWINNTFGQG
ncbi:uncharacterized protein LOC121878062 [Homarus americanus]|uniref:uncharacterized protein LOC121878062 n=1 Tax=Homarus americanus TaxID=6706 RepID=UPI001C474D02|nr:uncharacterized protein LOC121878062 [Homarus americanus]